MQTRTANLEEHECFLARAVEAARVLDGFFEVCDEMPKKAQAFFRTLKKPQTEANLQSIIEGKNTMLLYKIKMHKEKEAPRALSLSHVKIKKPLCKKQPACTEACLCI